MKSIEETHPSIELTFQANYYSAEFVLKRDVQKHTVDKQVLIDVLLKLEEDDIIDSYDIAYLKEELGLDE